MSKTENQLQCLFAVLEPEDIEPVPEEIPEIGLYLWWKRKKMESRVLKELGLTHGYRVLSCALLLAVCAAVLTACTCYVVQRLQFSPGLGIHENLAEPLYTMKETEHPILEEQGITVELLFLTYQSDHMTARLRITDRNDSYDAMRRKKEGVWPRFAGPGTSITGYGFDREQIQKSSEVLNDGGNQYEQELFMEGRSIELEDGGTYEIIMPGLEKSLSFTMEQADTYESLAEIGSCDIHGNKAVLAFAEKTEGGVAVRTYTYSSDAEEVLPVPAAFGKMGDDAIRLETGGGSYPWNGQYMSGELIVDGKSDQGAAMLIPIAEEQIQDEMIFSIPGLWFETDEVSAEITVPIPQGESGGQVAGEAEFRDCIIRVSGEVCSPDPVLEKIYPITVVGEEEDTGRTKSFQISQPGRLKIYLEIQEKNGTTVFQDMICERKVMNTGRDGDLLEKWLENEKIFKETENKELEGFLVSYREGDQEVKIRFRNPVYYDRQEFRIHLMDTGE